LYLMERRIVIAVDGPAGVGKSTTARAVAEALGYIFIDSGAMYRAVTLYLLQHGISPTDEASIAQALPNIRITFQRPETASYWQVCLNDENVAQEVRRPEISACVSEVAAVPAVRDFLVAQQRGIGQAKGVVMDGRDIGTVVFPNAELKVFMTADPEARVQRRLAELRLQGLTPNPDEVRRNLQHRDHIDSSRAHSPLRQAPDARVLDTTALDIPAQVSQVLAWAREVQLQVAVVV
jgi:cytidylate kinase